MHESDMLWTDSLASDTLSDTLQNSIIALTLNQCNGLFDQNSLEEFIRHILNLRYIEL